MADQAKPKRKKSGKKTAAPPSNQGELVAEALDYRRQGWSPIDIAEVMKLPLKIVEKLITIGLEATHLENPRLALLLEIQRCQEAQKAIATGIANGEPEAIRLNMQIEERVTRLKIQLDPNMRELFSDAALFIFANITASGRRKNGRPPHHRTLSTVAQVKSLAQIGLSNVAIAKQMGISLDTLDKYYETVIEVAKDRMLAQMGGVVVETVMKGDGRLGLEVLSRHKVPGWTVAPPPSQISPDVYVPAAERDAAAPATVTVIGGFPKPGEKAPGADLLDQIEKSDVEQAATALPSMGVEGDGDF